MVAGGFADTASLESDILDSASNGRISRSSAYELQVDVVGLYSEWLDMWNDAYPNNNNIKFWQDYQEVYTYRTLSAIALADYYYYNNTSYFEESNSYLSQAVSIQRNTNFNSC